MKKVYITPTVFFDEVLDCGELLTPVSERTNDLTDGGVNVNGNGSNTITGDGGTTSGDGFVTSKEGFFDDDIMSDWDL